MFFLKWANPGLFFVYFRFFQTNIITIFTTNICKKCPSSIRCWDSNRRTSERESLPITTRPGSVITLFGVGFKFVPRPLFCFLNTLPLAKKTLDGKDWIDKYLDFKAFALPTGLVDQWLELKSSKVHFLQKLPKSLKRCPKIYKDAQKVLIHKEVL